MPDELEGNGKEEEEKKLDEKEDKVDPALAANLCRTYNGISISALRPSTLVRLLDRIGSILWGQGADSAIVSAGNPNPPHPIPTE